MGVRSENPVPEATTNSNITLRPLHRRDLDTIVSIAHQNFDSLSFSLFPTDVVRAYKVANSKNALTHATSLQGTHALVAENQDGSIGGFMLTRRNGKRQQNGSYGALDLRRLHVDPTRQGNGIGKALFDNLDIQAQESNVTQINSHASGGSRGFFEKNGWSGVTKLNNFREVRTNSLVFIAEKHILATDKQTVIEVPEYVIYAGSNTTKLAKIREAVDNTALVIGIPSEEDPIDDVVVAAQSKAFSAAEKAVQQGIQAPLIVATDIRTDLLRLHPQRNQQRYSLSGRGKPTSDEEIMQNFADLRDYGRATNKPPVYIARAATYMHNPLLPHLDTVTVHDASIYLDQTLVEKLATPKGITAYKEHISEVYKANIHDMSAGFALPVFFDHNHVVGVNGLQTEQFMDDENILSQTKQLVLNGLDTHAVQKRLGIAS